MLFSSSNSGNGRRRGDPTRALCQLWNAAFMHHPTIVVPSLVVLTARSSPSKVARSASQLQDTVSKAWSVASSSLRRSTTYFGRRVESCKDNDNMQVQQAVLAEGAQGAARLDSCAYAPNRSSAYLQHAELVRAPGNDQRFRELHHPAVTACGQSTQGFFVAVAVRTVVNN